MHLEGKGLLSGQWSTVNLQIQPTKHCSWKVNHRHWGVLFNDIFPQLLAQRCTILKSSLGEIVSPEHFSAAMLGYAHLGLQVELSTGEFPLLDGSATIWRKALQELAGNPQPWSFYEFSQSGKIESAWGFLEYSPRKAGMSIQLSLSQLPMLGTLELEFLPEQIPEAIWDARTFILRKDWEMAQAQGLLKGAEIGQGLLLDVVNDELQILSGGPLRHPQEPLLHKALDLIGDLSLFGCQLPKLNIHIHNGGHLLHQQLLQRILEHGTH